MDAARRQYQYAPFMAPLQGAAMFMPYEGLKFGERKPKMEVEETNNVDSMPNFQVGTRVDPNQMYIPTIVPPPQMGVRPIKAPIKRYY
jgi:hypothetical protein